MVCAKRTHPPNECFSESTSTLFYVIRQPVCYKMRFRLAIRRDRNGDLSKQLIFERAYFLISSKLIIVYKP